MLHCDPEEITSGVGYVNFSKIVDTKEEICAIYKYKVQVEYDGLLRKTNLTTEKSNRLSLEAMGDYFFICPGKYLLTIYAHRGYTKFKYLNNRSNVQ